MRDDGLVAICSGGAAMGDHWKPDHDPGQGKPPLGIAVGEVS
ncbi:hypothetical protein ACQEU8_19100 [Streptomyces sp. CA-250714]